jgi:hypothetical protein
MADSDVSVAVPINIPLERSHYIGNIFRAILYGETAQKPAVTHITRI